MKNEQNVPQVRFKGFTDGWEQREFRNIANRMSETSLSSDELPYIEYEDVISNQGILNKDVSTKEGVKTGIVFSEEDVLYGKLRPYLHNWLNPDFKGIAVGDWWALKPINADKNFLYRLIQSENFDNVANQSTGTKMPRADWKLVSATVFCVPKLLEEQAEIGQYFRNLDHLITLHQRKCETLQKLKKSMLQKMFPKNGSLYPEIRFAGFTDAWEQRKCGDILIERNIQHPQSEEFPLVSFTVENGVTPKTERYEREQLVRGDKTAKKYKETKLDDIVYNPANLKFGAISRNKYGNAVFSPIYVTFEVDKSLALPSFVEMYVTRGSFIQNALQYQQGTVYERMSVNTEDFATLDINLPLKDEQQKLGEYFTNLDHLITLHQLKLETLKKMKKSMLQKMFPPAGRAGI